MLGHFDMIAIIVVLLGIVFAGVHIAIALGITAALGLYLMTSDLEVVRTFVANTAYEALRDYVFAVIPLFMLMGDFLAKCGAARDLYALGNRASRWLPGRLAAATIVANALFGFVTGVSIAAAAAFSRIAYPEMRRFGYRRDFALGCVAGSACLGMLIPPSVLMIVWCVLTELSIGKLFLAGVIPGLLAAGGMIVYVVIAAKLKPELVGETHASRLAARPLGADVSGAPIAPPADEESFRAMLFSTSLVVLAHPWHIGRDLARPVHADRGRRCRRCRLAHPGDDQRNQAARSLAGGARCRPHVGTAAVVAVLRATVFACAVDDWLYGGGQGVPAQHRAGPWGILLVMVASGSCSAADRFHLNHSSYRPHFRAHCHASRF